MPGKFDALLHGVMIGIQVQNHDIALLGRHKVVHRIGVRPLKNEKFLSKGRRKKRA